LASFSTYGFSRQGFGSMCAIWSLNLHLNHLFILLTAKPFLILTVVYFVLVGAFYRIELQEKQESLEDCRKVCSRLSKEIDQQ